MSTLLSLVNAFTRTPFRGNPAGVCLLQAARPEEWMKAVAAEMCAPETAFLVPNRHGFDLRWFTPLVEVPLCGHATLAAAHVLFGRDASASERILFETRSGTLRATRLEDRIELDFPVVPVRECAVSGDLLDALGTEPVWVGLTEERRGREANYLCILKDEAEVRSICPDTERLRRLPAAVIVSAAGSGAYAIVSRYFAPAVGIEEDPVTGSAHCALAHYWAPRLGTSRFRAWQASPRGGELEVTLRGERVGLAGHAVTVWSGECLV